MESTPDFKNRKGLLIFFGVILLLTGGISLLFAVLTLFTIALQQTAAFQGRQIPISSVLLGVFFYTAMAAAFITLGVGSIRTRRWAQSLTLLFSWLVLIAGAVTLVLIIFYAGDMFEQIGAVAQIDPTVLNIVLIITYVFIAVFFILVPGIFILVYQSKSVIKTVQKYDSRENWTDKCPLPLMAHSFFLLYVAIAPLFLISFGLVVPFFGIFLAGWPAAIFYLANSIICIYLAIEVYRLNIRAWHYSLYLFLLWLVSAFITLLNNDWTEVYQYMNIPAEQVAVMKNMGYLSNRSMHIMLLLTFVSYLIFYFYAKKYFKKNEAVAR